MQLNLEGRRALVCGASQGLGYACAASLAREGAAVFLVARRPQPLAEAVAGLSARGAQAHAVAADIATAEGRAAALRACPRPDILVTNAGGPPPGSYRDWDEADWLRALGANMLAPIELIKAVLDGMARAGFGRIVNITSGALKAPADALGLSNGARMGLTGFVAGIARLHAGRNVTINNLLPGAFLTARLRDGAAAMARHAGTDAESLLAERRRAIPAGRFGEPAEFGDLCAYLCSAQAGYITGQNLLIDGGAYRGVF
ncbi:SDR family oxidoreductase [Pigmentiphaga soli]|uniref:SDR family oxidoreductase n=1 Tax=Pigmentiphaga soli TaxID=1007095 RepID=A0ABP8GL13_9BURK